MKDDQPIIQEALNELTQLACRLGSSDATVISASDISVEDDLANLCQEPRCENYGLSASCPPHVTGPSGFRKLVKSFRYAVVFKIDVPLEILLSDQRQDIFQVLHTIAADVEQAAVKMGFAKAKAFAGGSCKKLFCRNHVGCKILTEGGKCRNPHRARPSMSGFGINVSRLVQAAGWNMDRVTDEPAPGKDATGTVSGLILIC